MVESASKLLSIAIISHAVSGPSYPFRTETGIGYQVQLFYNLTMRTQHPISGASRVSGPVIAPLGLWALQTHANKWHSVLNAIKLSWLHPPEGLAQFKKRMCHLIRPIVHCCSAQDIDAKVTTAQPMSALVKSCRCLMLLTR